MSPELRKRVLVAVVGVPLVLLIAFFGGILFSVLVALISSLIIREMSRLLRKLDWYAIPWITYVINLTMITVAHFAGLRELAIVIYATLVVDGIASLRPDALRGARRIVPTFYVSFAVSLPFAALVMIRDSQTWGRNNFAAMIVLMTVVGGVWIVDTFAYFVGKRFGKHKLAPRLSPNKTIEGALGSVISGMIFAALWGALAADFFPLIHRIVIGFLIGLVSILGDLVQSMFKRAAGVKDSGSMFPGHGGVYDRFDSLMFVAPTIFLYALATGLFHIR